MATTYGDPLLLSPEDRPAMAFDGDPLTAWTEGAGAKAVGEKLVIDLGSDVTTDQVNLVQPQTGIRDRSIDHATLTFDDKDSTGSRSGPSRARPRARRSRSRSARSTSSQITVDGVVSPTNGLGPVGFAEVRIPGRQPVDELVRLPVDLLPRRGHELARPQPHAGDDADARQPGRVRAHRRGARAAPRLRPARGRSFALTGTARLDGRAPDETLDAVLGVARRRARRRDRERVVAPRRVT